LSPGQTITVRWRETINHPAHYRIAFDDDGSDDFSYPSGPSDFTNNGTVLLDNIDDANGGDYSAEVTLPDITCENCTLQLIQVMYDKQGNGWGNDDLYFQCADLALRFPPDGGWPDAGAPLPDAGPPPNDAGPPWLDAGMDSGADSGMELGTDSGSDSGPDSGFDGGMRLARDSGSDSGVISGMDSGMDLGTDSGAASGMDLGTDSGAASGMDAGMTLATDSGSDSGMIARMDSGTDSRRDAGGDSDIFEGQDAGDNGAPLDAGESPNSDPGHLDQEPNAPAVSGCHGGGASNLVGLFSLAVFLRRRSKRGTRSIRAFLPEPFFVEEPARAH
jgi:hypothetical protein